MRHPQHIKKPNILILLGWNDPAVFRAFGRYAREAGWHIESRLFYTEEIPAGWRGDGMIVSNSPRPDIRRFIRRQATLQPTVIFSPNDLNIAGPVVTGDNAAAGQLAARHLLERNHRHFAWFNAYSGKTASERRAGYVDTLRSNGHSCTLLEYPVGRPSASNWKNRRLWLAQRLRKLPRPLALFALDDQLALEAITVCVEQKWRVPEDISVVGVGNLELSCECCQVPLTSVDVAEDEVATRAAAVLDHILHGHKVPALTIIPPRGIIIRQSSDTLAVGNPKLQLAIMFMKHNLTRSLGTEHIADAAGVSRQTLYQLFRDELRCSPAEQLLQFRLERAQRQLKETRDPVEAVATACGFGTRRTFDRCFSRIHGLSPSAWRTKA